MSFPPEAMISGKISLEKSQNLPAGILARASLLTT
jgi:hypothetical protein